MGTVYALIDPRYAGLIRYVGSTLRPLSNRLSGHCSAARTSRAVGPVTDWVRELLDLGLQPDIRAIREAPAGALRQVELQEIARAAADGWPLFNVTGLPWFTMGAPLAVLERRLQRCITAGAPTDEVRAQIAARRPVEAAQDAKRAAWARRTPSDPAEFAAAVHLHVQDWVAADPFRRGEAIIDVGAAAVLEAVQVITSHGVPFDRAVAASECIWAAMLPPHTSEQLDTLAAAALERRQQRQAEIARELAQG